MVGYGIVVPLLPFFAREYGVGATEVGLLVSLYALMQALGGPFLGGLSDAVGRRPVILACLLAASGAYLLLALAGAFWAVALAVGLAGLAGGTPATAQAYIADSTAADDRARGLGLIGAAFGLGLMVGPALGGLLSLVSLPAPALGASALAFANFTLGVFVLRESLPKSSRRSVGLVRLNPVSQFAGLLRVAGIRPFLLSVLLLNLALSGLVTNFPLFGEARFGWGPAESGLFFAFVGVCAVATQGAAVGPLQRAFGEGRMLVVGLAVAATGLWAVAAAPAGWALYPLVGAVAVGFGAAIPAVAALISRRVPASGQGRLMGGQQTLLSLTLVFGPPLAGATFDTLGPGAPYLLGGTLALGAALAATRALGRE